MGGGASAGLQGSHLDVLTLQTKAALILKAYTPWLPSSCLPEATKLNLGRQHSGVSPVAYLIHPVSRTLIVLSF